ncbi:hydroxymethylglutaryl-CoA synthase family protein, partial [Chloroflexota bacterium]
HRLSRSEIAKAWGKAAPPGEKAVANHDEDSLTMAVAAAMDCTAEIDPKSIDGLYFASTTSPYREKQAATTIATAVDLNRETFTVDFGNSLRCGTSAMRAAMDAVNGSSARSILVCAADTRLGFPNGEYEMSFGDGAAALLIGNTNVAVAIEGSYTLADEIIDVWRSYKDIYVRSGEDRFVRERGYTRIIPEAVSAALKKYNLTPKDFSKFVCYAPSPRELTPVARGLGFDLKTQVQDTLYDTVGNTGTASPLMSLVAALEEAKAGDRILLVSYGDGCDIFILKVTEEIENIRNRRGIKGHLSSKGVIPNYQKYMKWRDLIEVQPAPRPTPTPPSIPALWRDTKGGLALYGVKCKHCGFIQYPAQRVCINCQNKDEFEPYCFARKKGNVFTFSHDNLAASIDPPTTIAVVDFPEGGRIRCDVTDRNMEEIKVGVPVEMTFRNIGAEGNIYNYWWKCRPVR